AIAAAGLVELARLDSDPAHWQRYLSSARAILASLSSSAYLAEGTNNAAILLHGTQNRPDDRFDTGLVYGDYYFLEALLRYLPQPRMVSMVACGTLLLLMLRRSGQM